ncbi:site-specific DNA-methyltransferase [Burkholderia multivorans]|uniref:site-specific DNA-methyltransferase n=1 Tax=Burkholderia multivorans TaxID=87883 RepID=UPI0011B1CC4D|nr:site-specific DNA-methyltransferase [Burkholderia multivorans]
MASDIALDRLREFAPGSLIVDPMAGSGTVLRTASELGLRGAGFDLDPLAVLMTRVWTTKIDTSELIKLGDRVIAAAITINHPKLEWIDNCVETKEFVQFWFEPKQIEPLRKLAFVLRGIEGPYGDALRLALSRIIVTKERGASLARDTSHSRPHRTFFGNDYDVMRGYRVSVRQLADRLSGERLIGGVVANVGDARNMDIVPSGMVDAVVTSPPYLNAIDYLRGHKLALVWLGANIPEIRRVRGISIGAEHRPGGNIHVLHGDLMSDCRQLSKLPARQFGIVARYVNDLLWLYAEFRRIIKPEGKVISVVGDSCLRGIDIPNARLNSMAARAVGLKEGRTWRRSIPSRNRYLPTSSKNDAKLSKRMTSEFVMEFLVA